MRSAMFVKYVWIDPTDSPASRATSWVVASGKPL